MNSFCNTFLCLPVILSYIMCFFPQFPGQVCPFYRVAIVTESRVISMDNMIDALIAQLGPDKVEERRRQVVTRLEQEQQFR